MKIPVRVTVNGVKYTREVEPRMILSDFLRDELGLKGTNVSCGVGVCGSCSVLLNGRVVKSCILLAATADGAEIATVEGLAEDARLHPIQEAFWESHAVQCGFCTSGFLMAVYSLLKENPSPDEEEIREFLSGNLCRCTGYKSIIDAVRSASRKIAAVPAGERSRLFRW